MATPRTAPRPASRGLTAEDLEHIRSHLAAGRRPKVVFTEAAGQIAGQVGQVVELTDPDGSDEFVVVRFGRDELPFSPTDLAIPPRGSRRPAARPEPEPEFLIGTPPVPTPREEPTVPRSPRSPASMADDAAAKDAVAKAKDEDPAAAKEPAAGDGAPVEPRPARKAARPARPKAPAALTVTLAYADGEWTVGATQGAKALAKPYLIKPTEALKMVALLDVPGVHEAVEQIVAAERAEAEQQAQRLREQLAEVEARLAELRTG